MLVECVRSEAAAKSQRSRSLVECVRSEAAGQALETEQMISLLHRGHITDDVADAFFKSERCNKSTFTLTLMALKCGVSAEALGL